MGSMNNVFIVTTLLMTVKLSMKTVISEGKVLSSTNLSYHSRIKGGMEVKVTEILLSSINRLVTLLTMLKNMSIKCY